MRVLKCSFGQHYNEYVDVLNDDMSRRFLLRPFDKISVYDVAKSKAQLFCLARSYRKGSQNHITELAVFDINSGAEIKRVKLPFQAYTVTYLEHNKVLAIQFLERELHFLDANSLEVMWQTEPFYVPELKQKKSFFGSQYYAQSYKSTANKSYPYPPGCAYLKDRVFEDTAGSIWGLVASSHGERKDEIIGTSAGVLSFDLAAQKHTFYPVEFSPWSAPALFSPSPDGKLVLRHSPQEEFGPSYRTNRDTKDEYWLIERKHLDLWSVPNQTPLCRLHVSDVPVGNYKSRHDSITEKQFRRLAAWTKQSRDQYRLPFKHPPRVKKVHEGIRVLSKLGGALGGQSIRSVYWEPDSKAFWVACRGSLRRICIDGTRGPLLFFERYLNDENRALLDHRPAGTDIGNGEVYPMMQNLFVSSVSSTEKDISIEFSHEVVSIPKSIAMSKAPMLIVQDDMITIQANLSVTAADIAPFTPGLVQIKSWEEVDVQEGLLQLAHTLRSDLLSLTSQGISLIFQVGPDFFEEKQFVEELGTKDIAVTSGVKAVIDAWCDSLRQHKLTFKGGEDAAGPLARFLEYLAERDDFCSDQLRAYCTLRDGEFERYSRDTVLNEYLERLELNRPDLWQLTILYTMLFGRDGSSFVEDGGPLSAWVVTGILEKARTKLTPEEFMRMIQEEFEYFEAQPDVFAAFGTHKQAVEEARQDLLMQLGQSSWDKRFAEALSVVSS
ncbi:hypothetical protein [Pseudovibrio sp. Ad37]|uniref:hypothetical protein n=1 Tax=Pseudovibrio sp. Ad37 TaxID=989422 RepID=UPI0007AE94F5|nr:hypothetical protein [Pseudovibrio sp. Ad37]KZL29502.1 hypothetical protein PsAD37_00060 [Pseudovibrio sp. Ad37]